MKFSPNCNGEYFDTERFCPQDGTPLRTHESPGDLTGTIVAGRYHVTGKLGEGGMGEVYLAEHVRMKRKVALKVLPPRIASDADAISRFNREASNAGQIEHPNVAAIYDFGESDDGIVYLAMEYVEGESLARVLATHGALSPTRAADIVHQVAAALDAAHRLGIVHRDLKPDNILLGAHHDSRDKIKVVDFGISKVTDAKGQTVTHSGVVIGTPDFMSPEQLAGDVVDFRSDIYSLGIVAFNLLTGQLPFQGKDGSNVVLARLTDPPLRLVDVTPDRGWSIDVQRVLDRALHIDRDQRFASASQFGAALVDAVTGLPKDGSTMSLGAIVMRDAPTTTSMSSADLSMIEARLMNAVGPIARVLVRRAAAGAATREALIASLAAEIDDEHERDQFRGAFK